MKIISNLDQLIINLGQNNWPRSIKILMLETLLSNKIHFIVIVGIIIVTTNALTIIQPSPQNNFDKLFQVQKKSTSNEQQLEQSSLQIKLKAHLTFQSYIWPYSFYKVQYQQVTNQRQEKKQQGLIQKMQQQNNSQYLGRKQVNSQSSMQIQASHLQCNAQYLLKLTGLHNKYNQSELNEQKQQKEEQNKQAINSKISLPRYLLIVPDLLQENLTISKISEKYFSIESQYFKVRNQQQSNLQSQKQQNQVKERIRKINTYFFNLNQYIYFFHKFRVPPQYKQTCASDKNNKYLQSQKTNDIKNDKQSLIGQQKQTNYPITQKQLLSKLLQLEDTFEINPDSQRFALSANLTTLRRIKAKNETHCSNRLPQQLSEQIVQDCISVDVSDVNIYSGAGRNMITFKIFKKYMDLGGIEQLEIKQYKKGQTIVFLGNSDHLYLLSVNSYSFKLEMVIDFRDQNQNKMQAINNLTGLKNVNNKLKHVLLLQKQIFALIFRNGTIRVLQGFEKRTNKQICTYQLNQKGKYANVSIQKCFKQLDNKILCRYGLGGQASQLFQQQVTRLCNQQSQLDIRKEVNQQKKQYQQSEYVPYKNQEIGNVIKEDTIFKQETFNDKIMFLSEYTKVLIAQFLEASQNQVQQVNYVDYADENFTESEDCKIFYDPETNIPISINFTNNWRQCSLTLNVNDTFMMYPDLQNVDIHNQRDQEQNNKNNEQLLKERKIDETEQLDGDYNSDYLQSSFTAYSVYICRMNNGEDQKVDSKCSSIWVKKSLKTMIIYRRSFYRLHFVNNGGPTYNMAIQNLESREFQRVAHAFFISIGIIIVSAVLIICSILLKQTMLNLLIYTHIVNAEPIYTYPLNILTMKIKMSKMIKKGFVKYFVKRSNLESTGKQQDTLVQEDICCFCLETMQEGQTLLQIYCRHQYHGKCFEHWISNEPQARCPFCKRQFNEADLNAYRLQSSQYRAK